MFNPRALITMLTLVVLFSHAAWGGNDETASKRELVRALQGMVTNILQGTDLKGAGTEVDAEAYLIDGKYFESLPGVLQGESTHCKLIEGTETKIVFQSLTIMDNYSAALMILKTQAPSLGERFHSIVFFHDPGAAWKIKSWHISQ